MIRFRSVVSRIVALHLLAIIAAAICMPVALFMMLSHAAQGLHQRALRDQAAEILRYLGPGPGGTLRLSLPAGLAAFYSEGYGRAAYAVLDGDHRVLFSSRPDDRPLTTAPLTQTPFQFFSQHSDGDTYYGVTVTTEVAGRPLLVQVSEDLAHRDVLIDDIVAEFFSHVGWITIPLLLLLLLIDVLIFRRAVKPIIAASALAEQIGPNRTELRLPEIRMPREVLPLVHAVNHALDRLDAGFRAQREFTADAAHELRTPLAILRTQIDVIDDRELAGPLRQDVESMSRLVNQLLEISELESFVLGDDEIADLVAIATEIAAFLAPLAVSQRKTVAVTGSSLPVIVPGNADAIGRAIRNLVENALAHTAPGTTVEIQAARDGVIRVMDRGPGVPWAEREHIFKRFWRRDRRRGGNAGLGLAIVARIAEMHGAEVEVGERPGGGAVFAIRFPVVLPSGPVAAGRLEVAH
ncbi:MAG TPA: ATP-binding protein [Stellaceae bacterium]|nr:ATP-binding protein [Stellaceae bacterium]